MGGRVSASSRGGRAADPPRRRRRGTAPVLRGADAREGSICSSPAAKPSSLPRRARRMRSHRGSRLPKRNRARDLAQTPDVPGAEESGAWRGRAPTRCPRTSSSTTGRSRSWPRRRRALSPSSPRSRASARRSSSATAPSCWRAWPTSPPEPEYPPNRAIRPSAVGRVTMAASGEDPPTHSGASRPRSTARRCPWRRVRHPRRHPQRPALGRTRVVCHATADGGDGSPLCPGHPGRCRNRAFRTRHPPAPGCERPRRAATALSQASRADRSSRSISLGSRRTRGAVAGSRFVSASARGSVSGLSRPSRISSSSTPPSLPPYVV